MSRFVRKHGGGITGFGNIPEANTDNIVEFPTGTPVGTAKCSGGCGRDVILPRMYVEGMPIFCGPKGCRKSGSVPSAFAL